MNIFQYFNAFKKGNLQPEGWTDIHCHVLPGIDDGAPDLASSVQLVKGLMSLGCTHIIATPHIIGDIYPNNEATIAKAAGILKIALIKENISIPLGYAAEYILDDYFLDLLNSGQPLLKYGNNFILTEFSYATTPNYVEEMVDGIKEKGFQPILAHPERYVYFHKNLKNYHYLKELGFKFQLNLLSLTGFYGGSILKVAEFLLKNKMFDFVASDLHNLKQFVELKKAFKDQYVNQLLLESNRKLINE